MCRAALVAITLALAILSAAFVLSTAEAQTLKVVPTTTLAAETGNNTSASNLFTTTSNGDLGATNISKVDTHTLLYPGFSGKIYAHLMGWFCMQSGSTATGAGTLCGKHIQVGYNSNDAAVVQAQVNDMVSRGFDGIIHDWYGPGKSSENAETDNVRNAAEQHPNFTFALMIDQGAIKWFSCYPTCTATDALLQLAQYAANNYFSSPAYLRINGRPVLTNFGVDSSFSVDWNYVAANTPGNPIFLFQNAGGFTHTVSSGSYAWVMPGDSNYGLDYLGNFYNTGMKYPSELTVGGMYKGFNDTLASWSGNRIMSQQCGQTWLQTFAKANSIYNSSNQLGAIQLITWDDYEEGTELETGIDNCFSLSASMAGSSLAWTITGDESTIDHYTVFISLDGQNLMSLSDFPVGTRQVDLPAYSPDSTATYTLYVKAVGKPSLRNQMSGPVTFSYTPGVHMNSPANGTTIASPVNVSAYTVSNNPISAMTVYVDGNAAYQSSSASVSTSLAMTAGPHVVTINALDTSAGVMQATANINVVAQPPTASLSLSSTTGLAPVTVMASTSGSTDPNSGAVLSSAINWGDGTSSAGATASHTYKSGGTYTVTATVTDNYGLSASTIQAVNVQPETVTITSPTNGTTMGSAVHVTANAVSSLSINAIIVYLDYQEVYRTYSASVDTMLTMAPGQHLLTTNAWDSANTLMQSHVTITVDGGPTAALSLSSTSGIAPLSVTASTSSSTDAYATISSSTINWGDGTSTPGPSATHTYSTSGTYNVTATVTNSLGLSSTSAAQTVTVQSEVVNITSPGNGATVNAPIQVTANTVSGGTVSSIAVYLDGNSVYSTSGGSVNTAIAAAPGAHTIMVKATDSLGATFQSSVTATVSAQAIVPSLSVTVSSTSTLTMTASTAGSTDLNAGATLSSVIAWGDGTSSSGSPATHTYAKPGTYTVSATVSDNYGVSASTSAAVTAAGVVIGTPLNGTTLVSPVHLTASTISAYPISAIKVYLDYNEVYKTLSNSVDINLTMGAGQHLLTTNAWDINGRLMQARVNITVPSGPTAGLSVSMSGATATASTSSSTDAYAAITSSVIKWGDGTSSPGPTATHTYAKGGNDTVTATVTDTFGLSASKSAAVTAAGVVIWKPTDGSAAGSPVHVSASAYDSKKIASMIVYVDGTRMYLIYANSLDTYISMNSGSHTILVKAWEDVTGIIYQSKVTVTVP